MTADPTPQHDHGAAGFCTDHGQAANRPTTTPEALGALRERVAAALYDGNEAFHAALAHERGQEYQRISRPPWVDTHEYYRALYLARADAALAVIADAPGLAAVLREHRLNFGPAGEECQADKWVEGPGDDYETHLADVVAAHLAGEPR